MLGIIAAEAVWMGSAILSLLSGKSTRWATLSGTGGAVIGCAIAIVPTLKTLLTGHGESATVAWSIPGAAFSVGLDPLSAFFLLPILILGATTAIFGGEYMLAFRSQRKLGYPWFLFNLMLGSMALVVVSRNGLLFLFAWELMTLACAFLVMFEDGKKESREAGLLYLVVTHIGTACLLPFFAMLYVNAGSLEFDVFQGNRAGTGFAFLFLLGLVGFGAKAGLMPFHVWLPEAHPAAPSHVSALMSGAIIKTGIYGLARSFTFFSAPPAWWGWTLVAMGAVSGVMGVLLALAQHDLKRLLAYHSIENIGIISMGLGLGMLGVSHASPVLAVLGFGGGLLHVLNHALFKGLLFLGAGAVNHATGTRDMDRLGGLLRRMPWTGAFFLVAAVAISGLPPLNGFISELLIYSASFGALKNGHLSLPVGGALVIVALALIGGLAAACFAKAFGTVFLGSPRSPQPQPEHAPREHAAMLIPMGALALACVAIGLSAPLLPRLLGPVIGQLTGLPLATASAWPASTDLLLKSLLLMAWAVLLLTGLVTGLRQLLLRKKKITAASTWGCGYALPTVRMQYSSSSFAQPLTTFFRPVLGTRKYLTPRLSPILSPLNSPFPASLAFHSETPDATLEEIYRPASAAIRWSLGFLRWVQHGRIQLYVLYVAFALLALLIWKLGVT